MYKHLNNCLTHLFAKNIIYLTLIHLNLTIQFCSMSTLTVTKSLQNKCPSSSVSFHTSRHELNTISDQLIKELTLNYSKSDRLLWKRRKRHNSVADYMTHLYGLAANEANTRLKYSSRVIRSVTNSETSSDENAFHFFFDLSKLVATDEHIIEAEFHIFKLKSEPKNSDEPEAKQWKSSEVAEHKHNLLEVKVFQILNADKTQNRLLDVRRMSTHSLGWDVFYVKPAVIDWIRNETTNYGLSVSVTTLLGEHVRHGFRFAKRSHRRTNKQPMIVVFSADLNSVSKKERIPANSHNKYDYGFPQLDDSDRREDESKRLSPSHQTVINGSQLRRSTHPSNGCLKRQIYIDLEDLEWSAPIILPKGLTLTTCDGQCPHGLDHIGGHPSGAHFNRFHSSQRRCCLANTFSPLILLYFDQNGNVVLRSVDHIIADDCSCLPSNSSE